MLSQLVAGAIMEEGAYRAWDDMGVEVEVAEFLYGLVRLMKPERVVESGTGNGYSSVALATALYENGSGDLVTYEPRPEFRHTASARLYGLPATVREGYACDDEPEADLAFIDSWGEERGRELPYWLERDVSLLVHDSKSYDLPEGIVFPTPRGLWWRP